MIAHVPFNCTKSLSQFLPQNEAAKEIFPLSGGKHFDNLSAKFLSEKFKCANALVTPSCSSALELSMIILNLKAGDEVVMPSYTFSSTANAVALRGATPVFVDVDPETFNIDPHCIKEAITENTKCILVVHYGGVSCDMDSVLKIAKASGIYVVEDAAQAIGAKYKDRYLGTIGNLGTFSFHETKNVVCGEGGSILFRESQFYDRAEIIREKGTNRRQFLRGEIDKYTWREIGSSFLLGEISCYYLYHQLLALEEINKYRLNSWNFYFENTKNLETQGYFKRQLIPSFCNSNGHMFFIVLEKNIDRQVLLAQLREKGVFASSHYIPLHETTAGKVYGSISGKLPVTNRLHSRLIRLPLYYGISKAQQEYVIHTLTNLLRHY